MSHLQNAVSDRLGRLILSREVFTNCIMIDNHGLLRFNCKNFVEQTCPFSLDAYRSSFIVFRTFSGEVKYSVGDFIFNELTVKDEDITVGGITERFDRITYEYRLQFVIERDQ